MFGILGKKDPSEPRAWSELTEHEKALLRMRTLAIANENHGKLSSAASIAVATFDEFKLTKNFDTNLLIEDIQKTAARKGHDQTMWERALWSMVYLGIPTGAVMFFPTKVFYSLIKHGSLRAFETTPIWLIAIGMVAGFAIGSLVYYIINYWSENSKKDEETQLIQQKEVPTQFKTIVEKHYQESSQNNNNLVKELQELKNLIQNQAKENQLQNNPLGSIDPKEFTELKNQICQITKILGPQGSGNAMNQAKNPGQTNPFQNPMKLKPSQLKQVKTGTNPVNPTLKDETTGSSHKKSSSLGNSTQNSTPPPSAQKNETGKGHQRTLSNGNN